MKQQEASEKAATETIEIKITIKRTITGTESNKKAACRCCESCKR